MGGGRAYLFSAVPPKAKARGYLEKRILYQTNYLLMNATIMVDGKRMAFIAGKDEVQSVFGGDKGELVVVYKDEIVKFYGYPFMSTVPRKEKDIEA